MCRRTEEILHTIGLPRHRHSVGLMKSETTWTASFDNKLTTFQHLLFFFSVAQETYSINGVRKLITKINITGNMEKKSNKAKSTPSWGYGVADGKIGNSWLLQSAETVFPGTLPQSLLWGSVLLYLQSPKGGCRSISNDLSCSFMFNVDNTHAFIFQHSYVIAS